MIRRSTAREVARDRTKLVDLPLLEFVPALTPSVMGEETEAPEHLRPIADIFERILRGEEVRVLVSVPPQYGKTFLILHAVAKLLAKRPQLPIIYTSYGDMVARDKSREARDYARRAGVQTRKDANAVGAWLTEEGGGLRARGVGSAVTGSPAKLLIVDDPHKDRADAESALKRARVRDWFTSTAMSRVHPGASVIVNATRWHPDDLIGTLSKETKEDGSPRWEIVNLPAILPDGSPLWDKRPLSFLEQHRANEYDWWSLWMGQPRGRGNAVFRSDMVRFYDRLPDRFRVGKGIDCASTAKTSSCFNAAVTMLEDEGLFYVVDVLHRQCRLPEFARMIEHSPYPGRWHWFGSSTEIGSGDLMSEMGVPVETVLATTDKFARAQPVSSAWNAGKILLPRSVLAIRGAGADIGDEDAEPSWLRPFVDEITRFTGVGDLYNDQVDAFASAYEGVRHPGGIGNIVEGDGSRYVSEDGGGRRSVW